MNPASLHKIISFAECLICGGRGFFGLTCQKCNEGVYNIGIGFCTECNSSGTLGTLCQNCRLSRYQCFSIKCFFIGYSTIFNLIKPDLDKVCYNDIQRSFLQRIRDKNLIHRYYCEVEMKRLANSRRAEDPEDYLPEHLAVMDLKRRI